ncbi:hypothetical protein GCM10009853_029700 [Glycomyces scopariae]
MNSFAFAVAVVGRALVQGLGRVVESARDAAAEAAAGDERDRADYVPVHREERAIERGTDYGFKEEWKERLVYTDPRGTFEFPCGWGDFSRPYHVYVPMPEFWDRETPAFMHGRRDEILDRLRLWAGDAYIIEEYDPDD